MSQEIYIDSIPIGEGHPFVLIAGPCVMEGEAFCLDLAASLRDIASGVGLSFIFKASLDKANRTSIRSYRGPGLEEGLRVLQAVKKRLSVPVLTDIHESAQAGPVALVADILQIPAFLCRQTDLLVAAARTGRPVNVKKGQFLSPWDMRNVADKIVEAGNSRVLLTERGYSFGYNNLVVDFRSLPILRSLGFPVVYDATHSLQMPGGRGDASGGQREYLPELARAAVAVGIDALFMEVHPDPDAALSDSATQWPLHELPPLLGKLKAIDTLVKG
ncbi:MAG: 3-deoxy-8-phosphooctulonate synthase [Armatimonadetes bacterium]|nr:3-deoxy-8-phosphooctulonate synthase [Armatimonadota bacterium]